MIANGLLVVAGALQRADARWLMHQRPVEKHHGGLWEFPGGKVEPSEIPREALCRELAEELGILVAAEDCAPLFFAEERSDGANPAIVILLYKITRWRGEPRALEGEAIDWFGAAGVSKLAKPPLDSELAARLFGQ
ncbi:MAG: (deoxy)nucleoside triphosphate pyrophosphohydrolase [Erythrobacter sp.]|uniref:(deoxy)nucleoside triphosphate pyrophosphohydrolase n=1 Tax=Erythrobacter sp. TaxID=1042 RepID=UPI00262B10F1|nr:(deoxy)nucleoside triphosphate pyrophosphohydrolase [Erythrobacter sp.]MDJ0977375.1 (deoxy)nucleoside triphosphate pyrophosphohydrolase [Erythrobacter sp.]